eukprot:TRINITY_DN14372_c0_g1_i2.p1 TRINITY_DN14372_c0_g1~~TRINITY_DN14372_c0_g1_i2.p1  ORF type:complete len:384 (+),score=122.69 TRINITY_DN14372_c0_g1_i2:80-1231(+)
MCIRDRKGLFIATGMDNTLNIRGTTINKGRVLFKHMRNTRTVLRATNTVKLLDNVTEVDKGSLTSRQKLKGYFLECNKLQMGSYIKDLKDTIKVNKQIISNLLAEKEEKALKETMRALNSENMKLQEKVNKITKERDDLQAKLLIVEQIVEDYKGAEMKVEDRIKERTQEMLDQLNRKEYVVQIYEKKFHKLVPVLKKYVPIDPEVKRIVRLLDIQVSPMQTITNVVEANEMLATEVQTAREKVAELESQLAKATERETEQENSGRDTERKEFDAKSLALQHHKNSTVDDVQEVMVENRTLKQEIDRLEEDNELLRNALNALQKKNEMLGEELISTKEEVEALREKIFDEELGEKKTNCKIDDESFGNTSMKVEDIIKLIDKQ